MADRRYQITISADTTQYAQQMARAAQQSQDLARTVATLKTSATNLGVSSSGPKQLAGSLGEAAAAGDRSAGALGGVGRAASQVGGFLKDAAASAVGFISAQAVIGGASSAFREFVGATVEFDEKMRAVQSVTLESDGSLKQMGASVRGLSNELPKTASELSDGMLTVVQSGYRGRDAMEMLRVSANAATAGLTDTATAVRGIDTVLDAYALGVSHAAAVSDILNQAARYGEVSFSEMSTSVGKFAVAAAHVGVPIGDAAAAFTTMTKNGLDAGTAASGLNRVLLTMARPGSDLRDMIHSWGFESGVAALKAEGLQGVMTRIEDATNGDATALALLFPSMRSLPSVLALAANGGNDFTKSLANMGEAAGVTRRMVEEQAKGLADQWKTAMNNIRNAVIGLGQDITPVLARIVGNAREIVAGLIDEGRKIAAALAPGFHDLQDAVSDVIDILSDLWDKFAPIAGTALAAGVGAVVLAFDGLAAIVHTVTDVLDAHKGFVEAVAVLYGSRLAVAVGVQAYNAVVRLGGAVVEWGRSIVATMAMQRQLAAMEMINPTAATASLGTLSQIVVRFGAARTAGEGFGGAVSAAMSSTVSGAAAATAGLAVLAGGIWSGIAALNEWKNAQEKAFAKREETKFDTDTAKGRVDAMADLARIADQARDKTNQFFHDTSSGASKMMGSLTGFADGALGAVKKVGEGLAGVFHIKTGYWDDVSRAKAAWNDFADLAKKNVDLGSNVDAVWKNLTGHATNYGRLMRSVSADSAAAMTPSTLKVLEDAAVQMDKVGGLAKQMGFDLTQSGEKGKAAAEGFVEKLHSLANAAGVSAGQVDTLTRAGQLNADEITEMAETAQKNADAIQSAFAKTGDVIGTLGSKGPVSAAAIEQFYGNALDVTSKFLADSQLAIQHGFDPDLISRLLIAGPDQAGALLDTIAHNTDAKFRQIVTDSEAKLRELTQQAVEMQRLMNVATGPAASDQVTAQLSDAMRIAQQKMVQGAQSTVESIASALKLTPSQVAQIALSYGISLPDIKTRVAIDTITAKGDIADIRDRIARIPPSKTTAYNMSDPQHAREWWAELKKELMAIPELRDTVAQITDPQQAMAFWSALTSKINEVPATAVTTVMVNDQASPVLANISANIARITSRPHFFELVGRTAITGGTGGTGGRFAEGAVVRFADGGQHTVAPREDHVAQVASAGAVRVWAEPETGGEAYIPLAPAKRQRSLEILNVVAHEFGRRVVPAADGWVQQRSHWVQPPSSSAPTSGRSVTVNVAGSTVNVNGAADQQVIGKITRLLDERDRRLARELSARGV